jgi:homoserine O-acetyltransferase/O-succinyltransferase
MTDGRRHVTAVSIPGLSNRLKENKMNFTGLFTKTGSVSSDETRDTATVAPLSRRKLLVGGSVLAGAAALASAPSVVDAHADESLVLDVTRAGQTDQLEEDIPMLGHQIFELGNVVLQSGLTLRGARLAYKTYGELNAARDNAILMPTFFGGHHTNTESMMTPGRAIDPEQYFIIVPNLFGNGLSSSPSNTPPPMDRGAFPNVTVYDNVRCQHRLVTEHLDIDHLRLVVGFSMGAVQAFQWGALYSDMVDAIAPICGAARTSPLNKILLDGARAALTADAAYNHGWYDPPLLKGLMAFARVYSSLVFSPAFFREQEYKKLGQASPEDTMQFFEGFFRMSDANDLLAKLWTWHHADISANEIYNSDFVAALRGIKSRVIVLTAEGDNFFDVGDSRFEVEHMPNAELRVIRSIWGHLSGLGANPPDNEFVDAALGELL